MKNVVVFVNPNAFNDYSLNHQENDITIQLIKSSMLNNLNAIEIIVPQKRLTVEEIIPHIYTKTKKEFEAIYFVDKANIARTNDEVHQFVSLASDSNIEIITEKEGNLSDDFKSTERVIKEKQAKKKSELYFEVRKQANLKGKYTGGKIPFGYKINLHGNLEVVQEEAKIIKEIFELYKKGLRAINVSRHIGDIYNLKNQTRKNHYWKADRIFGYLTNPLYNGYPTFNRTTKNKGITKILPREEWDISPVKYEQLEIIDDETFQYIQERVWKNDEDKPLNYKVKWDEKEE